MNSDEFDEEFHPNSEEMRQQWEHDYSMSVKVIDCEADLSNEQQQGCPLSAYLFITAVETLANK